MDQEAKIAEIQKVILEAKRQDIEESEDAFTSFQCDCCGKMKLLAGSLPYGHYRYCNECALLTEIALFLGKIHFGYEMVDVMADKRLKDECDFLKLQQKYLNN